MENYWELEYFLPFKPSSLWKMLFMRIRKSCVGSETTVEMIEELYWMDGLIFYFGNKKIVEEKSILELELVKSDNRETNGKKNFTLKLKYLI